MQQWGDIAETSEKKESGCYSFTWSGMTRGGNHRLTYNMLLPKYFAHDNNGIMIECFCDTWYAAREKSSWGKKQELCIYELHCGVSYTEFDNWDDTIYRKVHSLSLVPL